jgi:arylsulfatase A-like enzyme
MLMMGRTVRVDEAGSTDSSHGNFDARRLGFFQLLALSAWCGLIAGLLEVGVILLRKGVFDYNRLFWMSRHFIWLIPLATLAVFLVVGLALSIVVVCDRGRGEKLATRLLGAFTFLPAIWAASPRIYGFAGFLLALGFGWQVVPALERRAPGFRRWLRLSLPIAAGMAALPAAALCGLDYYRAWREQARALPAPGSPNVLLIVMDTVRADHLSLHGYNRPTSPTLDELAARGIRFDGVQATSSWTLMSHSSMFTGRWPHELSASWFTPLDRTYPTLAEFTGSLGYATAGFVANNWYCASDSGLSRGFSTYRDYIFPRLTAFKSTVLVDRTVDGLQSVEHFLEHWLDFDLLRPAADRIGWVFKTNRKDASVVNREFLDWLSQRRQPERPFFAFLNFYDAHYPYELPPTGIHRFGAKPRTRRESTLMRDWPQLMQKGPSESQVAYGRDAYDNCVADLDEQLGQLMDELDRRSILGKTWVIITADHGESFGENHGVFWHGTSLYQAQLHVPLLIVPPLKDGLLSPRAIAETVSLRDLAATIVDLLEIKTGSPFPGISLVRYWNGPAPPSGSTPAASSAPALAEVVPLDSFGPDPSQWRIKQRWPLAALTDGDWTYIRREGELREELFRWREDRGESRNLVDEPAMRPTVERMRKALGRLTAGPLTPDRFNP